MCRLKKIYSFFCFFSSLLSADLVQHCKDKLIESGHLNKKTHLDQAIVYLHEQQEEKSFAIFFKALEEVAGQQTTLSSQEKALFDELLPLYLDTNYEEKLAAYAEKYPDFCTIQFLAASSYANQHKFEPFFYLFYKAYQSFPKCYLSYKMQAVLATQIVQRAKTPEEKSSWRKRAMSNFYNAFQECPQDVSLHKMMLYTAENAEKKQALQIIINTIVSKNIQIARSELAFYVNHALGVRANQAAQSLIDKAKSWYEYSRIIDQLQQKIKESNNG